MTLDDLSKGDLIKAIANMHDAVQVWDGGYGFDDEEGNKLMEIGKLCTDECVKNKDWELK